MTSEKGTRGGCVSFEIIDGLNSLPLVISSWSCPKHEVLKLHWKTKVIFGAEVVLVIDVNVIDVVLVYKYEWKCLV